MNDIQKAASVMGKKGGKRCLETMTKEERIARAKAAGALGIEARKRNKATKETKS